MHINIIPTRDFLCYVLTHKDDGGSEESWEASVAADKVLGVMNSIPEWDADLLKAISLTPEKGVVDWKLLWRNPQPQWASSGGRVVQLGDSAHSFLPTSGNGATQAMEDGLSLATCLRLGGRNGVQLSTKAHVKLRYVLSYPNPQNPTTINPLQLPARLNPATHRLRQPRTLALDEPRLAKRRPSQIQNGLLDLGS